ncbi:MAG: transporter substrate-binding domain-containing protein, partial [Bacteroidia bacterium]|nr:transporter substrate-binding domain-containing protein [Bacteroidia bacterium]
MLNNKFNHLLIIALLLLLAGCGNKETQITSLSMLEGGKTFAVASGTAADKFVLDRFPDVKLEYYNSVMDCALAVKGGKADAAAYDKPVLLNIAGKNEGLTVLEEVIEDDNYGFAVQPGNVELKNTIDEVLDELKSNGMYQEMNLRWFPKRGEPAPMPQIEFTGENGVLLFGTAAVTEPISFVDGNRNIVGFDIELASYVAQRLGKRLEVVDMEFGAMLPALISGKVEMIGAGLSITEERAKSVLFSKSYYKNGIAVIVRSYDNPEQEESGTLFSSLDDVADKRIGIFSGTVQDGFISKKYPASSIFRYDSTADLILSLKTGKTDAAMIDLITARVI